MAQLLSLLQDLPPSPEHRVLHSPLPGPQALMVSPLSKAESGRRATLQGVAPSSLHEGAGLLPPQLPTLLMLLCEGGPQDSSGRSEFIIAGNGAPAATPSAPRGLFALLQRVLHNCFADELWCEQDAWKHCVFIFSKAQGRASGHRRSWLAQPPTGSFSLSRSEALCILLPYPYISRLNNPRCCEHDPSPCPDPAAGAKISAVPLQPRHEAGSSPGSPAGYNSSFMGKPPGDTRTNQPKVPSPHSPSSLPNLSQATGPRLCTPPGHFSLRHIWAHAKALLLPGPEARKRS